METIFVPKIRDVVKNKSQLEKQLNVRLTINKNLVKVEGDTLSEYDAARVFEAINFGFSVYKALKLTEDDMIFRTVHIKDYTKRNLKDVKARLIGTKGKTRRTIAEISGCDVLIKESEVGIIGDAESIAETETAIIHIIKGSKQANMYRYLEKRNQEKKKNHLF